jgi:hypothetical protein
VWPFVVVVLHPRRDLDAGVIHAEEQGLVEQFAALASTARQEDRQTIAMARTGLEDVTRQLHGYIVSARRGDERKRCIFRPVG